MLGEPPSYFRQDWWHKLVRFFFAAFGLAEDAQLGLCKVRKPSARRRQLKPMLGGEFAPAWSEQAEGLNLHSFMRTHMYVCKNGSLLKDWRLDTPPSPWNKGLKALCIATATIRANG